MVGSTLRPAIRGKFAATALARSKPPALGIWIALNGLDASLTWLSLQLGAVEVNPLLSTLVQTVGAEMAMTTKLAAAAAVGGLMWQSSRWRRWGLLNWGMASVVAWNLAVIALSA